MVAPRRVIALPTDAEQRQRLLEISRVADRTGEPRRTGADYSGLSGGTVGRMVHANSDTARDLPAMSNDEVIKALTGIAGIGVWTANVFLIFNLQRLDVVPAADFGIRRGVQLAYGLKSLPAPELVYKTALGLQPYRSIGSI